jgi:hypothetical protein
MKASGAGGGIPSRRMKEFFTVSLLAVMSAAALTESQPRVTAALDIAPVWSAHPVGFALFTRPPWQFVAYYDDQRRATIAWRRLEETAWQRRTLPVTTGWDSHNYLTLALDRGGHLHLSGDMHRTPLRYFRSTNPLDPSSLVQLDRMTGELEDRTTYPSFINGPEGDLLFTYRDGGSGNGNQIYNRYDHATRTWSRLIDTPLTDGEGERNAYFHGPVKGPDGWFHLAWVWRETPDASTNHDLSHARSRDLVRWETASGTPLRLPIRLGDGATIDPVPSGGGIINGNTTIGFDHLGRVAISYHKYDSNGHTQPWTARFADGKWTLHRIADWPVRWNLGGGGSMSFGIHIGPLTAGEGGLTQSWKHFRFGRGTWRIDPATLRATGSAADRKMPDIGPVEGAFPGLKVMTGNDDGHSGTAGLHYQLRWETLGANRDKPRSGDLPPPSMLRLLTIRR